MPRKAASRAAAHATPRRRPKAAGRPSAPEPATTELPPNRTIINADVLSALETLPPDSIDCVITSPPYWALRTYHGDEKDAGRQWGAEPTFQEYLHRIDLLLAALRRTLKPTGTLWFNVGDVYSAGAPPRTAPVPNAAAPPDRVHKPAGAKRPFAEQTPDHAARCDSVARKSLIALPHRILVRAIDAGWLCRNDIIWHKASALPSSVKDRFTTVHEHIFLFSKSAHYYFDLDSVRKMHKTAPASFNRRVREALAGRLEFKPWLGGSSGNVLTGAEAEQEYDTDGTRVAIPGVQVTLDGDDDNAPAKSRRALSARTRRSAAYEPGGMQAVRAHYGNYDAEGRPLNNPRGKNPGDVQQFRPTPSTHGKHVATFPLTLAQWCLSAGCPPGGVVLDPFMGSGTVALAAERLGRRWLGIELSQEYIAEARRRLSGLDNDRLAPLPDPDQAPPPPPTEPQEECDGP